MTKITTNNFLRERRLRRGSPKHCCRLISGLDLLANPRIAMSDVIPAIPALGAIDPRLLARVQIDGTWPPYVTSPGSP